MRWQPHKNKNGDVFPLNHLHPFRYTHTLPARPGVAARVVTINVGFALHCFTKKIEATDCPEDLYSDERESRTFDYVRYGLSTELRNIAQTLANRRCSFAKHENYVTVDVQTGTGATVRYGVFFNLKKWGGEDSVLLVVQSAYSFDPGKQEPGRGKVGLNALVGLALDGRKPKPPP